jgi:hypothetical protein
MEPRHLVLGGLSLAVEVEVEGVGMVGVDEACQAGVIRSRVAIYLQLLALHRRLQPLVLTISLQALVRVSLHSRFRLPPSPSQNPLTRRKAQPLRTIDRRWLSSYWHLCHPSFPGARWIHLISR